MKDLSVCVSLMLLTALGIVWAHQALASRTKGSVRVEGLSDTLSREFERVRTRFPPPFVRLVR